MEQAENLEVYMINLLDNIENKASELKNSLIAGMEKYVIGQDEAKNKLAQTIINGVYNVNNDQGVLGAIMLAGPTGVGKTELARSLADTLLGSPDAFTKVDAGLFVHPADISQLTGSSPGYIGYGDTPKFADTEVHRFYQEAKQKERLHPLLNRYGMENFSIVLVDEFEKAHPDVQNAFLNTLQSGVMEMSTGKESQPDGKIKHSKQTDFSNTLFIFTSNVWERVIVNEKKSAIGFTSWTESNPESEKAIFQKELSRAFAPELLGRIDIVRCHALTEEHIRAAMRKHIERVNTILEKKNYTPHVKIELTDAYIDQALKSDEAKSMEFGARAISGVIKKIGTQVWLLLEWGNLPAVLSGKLIFDIKNNAPHVSFQENFSDFALATLPKVSSEQMFHQKVNQFEKNTKSSLMGFIELISQYENDDTFKELFEAYYNNLLQAGFTKEEIEQIQIQTYGSIYRTMEQPEWYEDIVYPHNIFHKIKKKDLFNIIHELIKKNAEIESVYMHIGNIVRRPLSRDEQIIIGQYIHRCIISKGA